MTNWTRFVHGNPDHEAKLTKFFTLDGLPHFARSREDIKVDSFLDHPASELYMLLNDDGDMVGSCGFYVTVDDNGITYCKSPYRLYIADAGMGAYVNNDWEEVTKDWYKRWSHLNIPFLTNVNVGNEKIIFYLIKSMSRYCKKLDPNDPFVQLQKTFHLHPKLVKEMHTWQYCGYTTNYEGFQREEKDLPPEFVQKIEELWAQGFWMGSRGRNKLE